LQWCYRAAVTDRADDRADGVDDRDAEQLRSGDGDAFVATVGRVVARRAPGTVGVLRAALGRPLQPVARRAAITGILRLGEDALLREVAHALRHDDVAVVIGAARILGDVGDRRAVPNLVEALRTDDEAVGDAVLSALGRLGDPAALPWIVAAAEHGFCVETACHALGVLGDARAEPILRRLRDDSRRRVALAAARALAALQER
jgi:HEAT repeat protein